MLKNTFCHVPQIGPKLEYKLWAAGIHTWDDFFANPDGVLSAAQHERVGQYLAASHRQLQEGNPSFFAQLLQAREQWRLFRDFRDSTAYVDIETNGWHWPEGFITTIALYDGINIRHYVRGKNLEQFAADIGRYKLIVTYNGKSFDVPFIEKSFQMKLSQAHVDLRYVLQSLGFKGGLKNCEVQMGIGRGDLDGIDGFFAVLLWQHYERERDVKALETLLAYNIEDTVNLEKLMVAAHNLKVGRTPFSSDYLLPEPDEVSNPFEPHGETVAQIKRRHGLGATPQWRPGW